jgi:hypothetical protein
LLTIVGIWLVAFTLEWIYRESMSSVLAGDFWLSMVSDKCKYEVLVVNILYSGGFVDAHGN